MNKARRLQECSGAVAYILQRLRMFM